MKMGDSRLSLMNESVATQETAPPKTADLRVQIGTRDSTVSKESSALFGHAYHRYLLVADLTALVISVTMTLVSVAVLDRDVVALDFAMTALFLAPVWIGILYLLGLFSQVERYLSFDYVIELLPVANAVTLWCWLLVVARSATFQGGTELITPAILWILMVPTVLVARAAARTIARKRPWYMRKVALIGDQAVVDLLRRKIDRHPNWGLRVNLELVRLEEDGSWLVKRTSSNGGGPRVGLVDHVHGSRVMATGLTGLVADAGIDRAMVAGGLERLSERAELVQTMLDRGIAVDYVSGGPETLYATAMPQHLEGMSLMSSRPSKPSPVAMKLKRAIDICLSSLLLVLTLPILAVAAFRIKRDSPGPVFYRQARSGRDGKIFKIFKLRTMCEGAHDQREELRVATEGEGNNDVLFKLEQDPRVTKVGKWLRRTSLDELPQLLNVLKGDMSMVGPRPLVPEEAEHAHGLFQARSQVKPGIAGPWQAEGRSDIPFEDMLRLDYSYVVGWSMGEDFRLLLRTLTAVVGSSGAR